MYNILLPNLFYFVATVKIQGNQVAESKVRFARVSCAGCACWAAENRNGTG